MHAFKEKIILENVKICFILKYLHQFMSLITDFSSQSEILALGYFGYWLLMVTLKYFLATSYARKYLSLLKTLFSLITYELKLITLQNQQITCTSFSN